MKSWIGFRIRVLLALVLVTAVLAADAEATCEVPDRYGVMRDCTWSEELGRCAANAEDSWQQCVDRVYRQHPDSRTRRAFGFTACDLGLYADMTFCIGSSGVGNLFRGI